MNQALTKTRSKKGFTLAELLIVVAIIAVLVAIAFPIFTGALDNARAQVEAANARSAHAEASVTYLLNPETANETFIVTYDDEKTYSWVLDTSSGIATVTVTGTDVINSPYTYQT